MEIPHIKIRRFKGMACGVAGEMLIERPCQLELERDIQTIERPWLDNEPYISCIPAGEYMMKKRDGLNLDLKYPSAWEVINVPDRSGILFHIANHPREVHGCIAPNMAIRAGEELRGYYSGDAMSLFENALQGYTEAKLTIINDWGEL